MHNLLSDVFKISTNTSDSSKKFMYEYSSEGQMFSVDDLDLILINRLKLDPDENKFSFLF